MDNERWLFIEDIAPTDTLKSIKSIPFTVTTITRPAESTGLSFPEKYKDHIFYLYGINQYTLIKHWDTNIPNVSMIRETNAEKFKINPVHIDKLDMNVINELNNPVPLKRTPFLESNDNMEAWASMSIPIIKFINELDVDATVSNPHGGAYPVMSDPDKIFIRFWAVPYADAGISCSIRKAFGIQMSDSQQDGYKPTGDGINLLDGDGVCVAQLYGTTIYVLFDLPHYSVTSDRPAKVMHAILELARPHLDTREKRQDLKDSVITIGYEKSKERYVSECLKRQKQREYDLQAEINEQASLQRRYSDSLAQAARRQMEAMKQMEYLSCDEASLKDRYISEFDKLIKVNKVKTVIVDRGQISIYTEFLYTQRLNDKTIRELGEYKIDLPVTGGNPRIYNLTRTIQRLFHPHDNGSNTLCLGNIAEGIAKLMASFEFSIVAQILIEFLQTINQDDSYGKRVIQWPILDEKKLEEQKSKLAAAAAVAVEADKPKRKTAVRKLKKPTAEETKEASA